MNKLLVLVFLFLQVTAFAHRKNDNIPARQDAISYAILPDSGYSFNAILVNNHLDFIQNGLLQSSKGKVYWLKITISNPGRVTGTFNMFVNPSVLNTIYYFDAGEQIWMTDSAGVIIVPPTARTQRGALPFVLNRQPVNVLYVKMDLRRLKQPYYSMKPSLEFEKKSVTEGQQDELLYGWVAAVSVLCFFLLYNLYLYASFRDVSVLYYLIAQVGATIYITGYRYLFSVFTHNKILNLGLNTGNVVSFYNIDNIMQHAGIMLIMFGLVQLTRSFLNTRFFLPRADRLLKYGLYFYLLASAILIVTNLLFVYVEIRTLLWDNIYLFLLISVIIYACIAAYRRKLRASGAFLLANVVPLVLMVCITLFHIFISIDGINDVWLPSLAILSQAFCFSVALVARTKLIQQDLNEKELEAQQLNFEVQKISISMQVEKARSELLQERLEANQRELASTTMYMLQKNELLATLRTQIEELQRLYPKHPHSKLSGMESILRSSMHLDDDWKKFKLHFEQLHPDFFEDLKTKYPSLTNNEVRLCAYFHINLSTKEIAALLNIEPDSVRRAKSRLLKKMGLSDTENALADPDAD
ncbi:MAG TPA: 7TM diverse intracellular signaling domain-containing protein [Chitinophagaceae bacterium]|nr:7TM diverse intracellular signaling domain-containing protein [Chitinophagaceae bacterium]